MLLIHNNHNNRFKGKWEDSEQCSILHVILCFYVVVIFHTLPCRSITEREGRAYILIYIYIKIVLFSFKDPCTCSFHKGNGLPEPCDRFHAYVLPEGQYHSSLEQTSVAGTTGRNKRNKTRHEGTNQKGEDANKKGLQVPHMRAVAKKCSCGYKSALSETSGCSSAFTLPSMTSLGTSKFYIVFPISCYSLESQRHFRMYCWIKPNYNLAPEVFIPLVSHYVGL